jgi:hypothetical protein
VVSTCMRGLFGQSVVNGASAPGASGITVVIRGNQRSSEVIRGHQSVPGASGIEVVVRTGGSVTTRSISEPGRIRPVAKDPNGFTCARGHRRVTTERTCGRRKAPW